ncbi:MAG TPA: hypothetical protein PKD79_02985 [Candidatus Doudnabacteria bacterium]|nr:hypothetical protein [Candidatus Doudnabacteria bacterium]
MNKQASSPQEPLLFEEVALSARERRAIESFKIEAEVGEFEFFGAITDGFFVRLDEYLKALGGNSDKVVQSVISAITKPLIRMPSMFDIVSPHFGIIVRAVLPNLEFEIPRWHTDGSYFTASRKIYKLVYTVKGEPTRFAFTANQKQFEDLANKQNQFALGSVEDLSIRKKLDSLVTEIELPDFDHFAVYLVGHTDAQIHSEPNMTESRVFMSSLIGSESEIEELRRRWL